MEAPAQEPSLWSTVREAVRGSEQDLTSIPIRRAVILLAVPTVLEMSMESLLTIVDIIFVSKLGPNAIATVGLTESMLSIVYALAMGLAAAATALVSRHVGEKDLEGAATAAVQVIAIATVAAGALGVVGALLAPRLLSLVGATPEVVAYGSSYAAVMLGGNVTIFLLFVVNAVFRAAGDAAVAMRSLWLANLLNMLVAPCLIFGLGPCPKLGVLGAAVATTASRAVGVLYQFAALARGRERLPVGAGHLAPSLAVLRQVARIATSATGQVLVETASWLGLVRILSGYGSVALAGYTVAMRIAIFAILPSWGLAGAAATLVGQNLGAGEPERAERSAMTIAKYNVLFLSVVGAIFVLLPAPVVGLVTSDAAVAGYATTCLRIVAVGFVFFAFGMVAVQAFNGAGATRTPLYVNAICFWLFKIPVAYLLARGFGLGPAGVFLAITVAYSVQATAAAVLFRRGRWKTKTLES